jgi:hypothetical protein
MPELSRDDLDALMEIRSRLKEETGQKLTLSSRDIYHELEAFWYITPNAITKSKIRGFLNDKSVKWDDPLAV